MSNGRGTRLPQVLVFADVWPQVQIHSERMELRRVAGNVPSPAELAAADVVLVIGPVQDAQYGLELAGAMKLALERGRDACLHLQRTLPGVRPTLRLRAGAVQRTPDQRLRPGSGHEAGASPRLS